jgi:hypothetical protein
MCSAAAGAGSAGSPRARLTHRIHMQQCKANQLSKKKKRKVHSLYYHYKIRLYFK